MGNPQKLKFKNVGDFLENISEEELAIVEILRELVLENVPNVKEKLAYNVPFYYRQRRICYIWPASNPWGGLTEGVCLGFVQGKLLSKFDNQENNSSGIFKKIYLHPNEINEREVINLLLEAVEIDRELANSNNRKI